MRSDGLVDGWMEIEIEIEIEIVVQFCSFTLHDVT
jgi:hypothetical protein